MRKRRQLHRNSGPVPGVKPVLAVEALAIPRDGAAVEDDWVVGQGDVHRGHLDSGVK